MRTWLCVIPLTTETITWSQNLWLCACLSCSGWRSGVAAAPRGDLVQDVHSFSVLASKQPCWQWSESTGGRGKRKQNQTSHHRRPGSQGTKGAMGELGFPQLLGSTDIKSGYFPQDMPPVPPARLVHSGQAYAGNSWELGPDFRPWSLVRFAWNKEALYASQVAANMEMMAWSCSISVSLNFPA